MTAHIPVLLGKVLEVLGDVRGKTVIDATFGAGGYSRAFLERGAHVIAYDRDANVAPFAAVLKKEFSGRFQFINDNFSGIVHYPLSIIHCPLSIIHCIVFDFGVSSMQIDTPQRGFSWRFDAPLDMRMGDGESAADLIARTPAEEIARILRDYGDVKKATPIARAIKSALPRTTSALRDLIFDPKDVAPVFQALRIAVNDELGEIERALDAVPGLLPAGGICACVTFHSLEDRLVKGRFRDWTAPRGAPMLQVANDFENLGAWRPDSAEVAANPRARSSHLRAVRKTASN